jgi:SAM-dependent methyltransferase
MIASNREWKLWGEKDPLYGVASWEGRSKEGANPWTAADFYHIGEQDWRDFQTHWARYGLRTGTCVEIGSGAGRITKQLATSFERVVAVDVSEAMLDVARSNISASNVRFHVADGISLPAASGSVAAVSSPTSRAFSSRAAR